MVKEESKWNTKGRNILINLSKKEKSDEEWWPRLTQSKSKNPFITIDWARWKEADDEDEDEKAASGGFGAGGMGDFDPNNMNDFQNMMGGNMGGDSDDEEEECQVEPHLPEHGQDKKLNADIDDLDGEETSDLK